MDLFGLHDNDSGRTGLSQIKVTPLVFAQLQHCLDKGAKVTHKGKPLLYNETQLLMALSHYMRDNKGPWSENEARDLGRLHKVAERVINDTLKQVEEEHKKNRERGLSFKTAQKKEYAILEKMGILPKIEEASPESPSEQAELAFEDFPSADNVKHILKNTLRAENVVEFLSHGGEPTSTVLMAFMVIDAKSELTDIVVDFVFDTFENKAKNAPEKEVTTNMLAKTMDQNTRQKQSQRIDHNLNHENDPTYQEQLHKMKGTHAHETERYEDKKHQFAENESMTEVPKYTAPTSTAKAKSPLDLNVPMVPSAPKPNFNDPYWHASGGNQQKDQDH